MHALIDGLLDRIIDLLGDLREAIRLTQTQGVDRNNELHSEIADLKQENATLKSENSSLSSKLYINLDDSKTCDQLDKAIRRSIEQESSIIPAIKFIRQVTNAGLLEAKLYAEKIRDQH